MSVIHKMKEFLKRKTGWEELINRPMTEEEKSYEEAKKRLYEIHLKEEDLFYAEDMDRCSPDTYENGTAWVSGETAKGMFVAGDRVVLLDNRGLVLLHACIREILSDEQVPKGLFRRTEKRTLILEVEEESDWEETLYQTFLIRKKEADQVESASKKFQNY